MELIKYDAACRAVAQAKTLDDVKEIKNLSEAARAYAKMAKNRQMEIDAVELRVRAERKEGEILRELKRQGVGVQGNQLKNVDERRVTFKELGIDSSQSSIAQRLAALPEQRFDSELAEWRRNAPTAVRLETPLQHVRLPTVRADRERARARSGRRHIEVNPLDRFRLPDGRRAVDLRSGELRRTRELAERVIRCVDAFEQQMPVANADPLSTMEMLFRSDPLLALLEAAWASPVDCGDAGLNQVRLDESRERRTRLCAGCSNEFVLKRSPHKDRPREGLFCSRKCASLAQSATPKSDDAQPRPSEERAGR